MPCKLYLSGDSDAVWLADPADLVLAAVERGIQEGHAFIRLDMPPFTTTDIARPAYFAPGAVSAILPVPPQEWQHVLDNPPEWFQEGDDD